MTAVATGAVVLHSLRPPQGVPRERVYFAFANGRFAYDCVTCNAKCCRGYGYQLQAGPELDRHVGTQPAVRFFLEAANAEPDGLYRVHNCPPGCFFLTEKGLCGIQVEHGYDAKPETCRLFPFNGFRRVGEYLVVHPHPGLCPLEILPGEARSENSGYESLFAAMSAGGIRSDVPEALAIHQDVTGLMALEARIVALSESQLQAAGYAPFALAQLAATREVFDGPVDAAARPEAQDLGAFLRLVFDVLGAAPAEAHQRNPTLVRTMVASTPFLRSQIVFPLRKDAERFRVPLERTPHMLLVLHTLGALAHEAGMRDVTYQSVARLFTDHRALVNLLAHVDCAVAWRPEVPIDLPFTQDRDFQSRYLRIARALLPGRGAAPGPSLGRVLCEHLPSEELTRVMFLKLLARRLSGRIVLRADASADRWRSAAVRARVQRWLLGRVGHDLLMMIAARQAKRSLPTPHDDG